MSIFFAEGNISDSSESEESVEKKTQNKKKNYQYDDDHFHEEKRVILNEKEKRNKIFKDLGNKVLSALKIMDYDTVWSVLQDFRKEIAKAEKLIEKDGYPRIFLKTLKQVNQQVQQTTAEEKKKLKNAKSFNIMKQKLKKEIMPQYQDQIDKMKPEEEKEESSEEEEEKISSDESDDEQEKWKRLLKSDDPMERRKYWLKRTKKPEKKDESSDSEEKKIRKKSTVNQKKKFNIKEIEKKQLKVADIKEAEALIRKQLLEYARLNSQEKRAQFLGNLDVILEESNKYPDFRKLSILLADIPMRIEITKQMRLTHFPRENWIKIFKNLKLIHYLITESEEDNLLSSVVHFEDSSENKIEMNEETIYRLIKTFSLNLDRELQKAFIFLDNGLSEYSERLQDLLVFVDFMYQIAGQMSSNDNLEFQSAEITFKVLENMYYMSDIFLSKINSGNKFNFTNITNLQEYSSIILKKGDKEMVTKAILYLVYNHAVNRREKGKDLLLISNILQNINGCDYETQACFNRTLAQLGINAFCQGSLHETQQFLSQLCGYGKSKQQNKEIMKELLGQPQISQKQSIKNKPFPYYLHFNLNLLEAIELISSMIIQIPYTLIEGGRITSKTLKRLFNEYEKSHFIAEPLNYRDLIYAASNDLKLGNWKECFERLMEATIWIEFTEIQIVKKNLLLNIKESALHCYLIGNQKCFKCVSLDGLSKKFELDMKTIKRFIYRWIHKQLHATVTDDGYLNMIHKREQKESSMRQSCEKLFMKLEQINKVNEEMLSQQVGTTAEEEEQMDKDAKVKRRINPAMTDKLKAIISRRG